LNYFTSRFFPLESLIIRYSPLVLAISVVILSWILYVTKLNKKITIPRTPINFLIFIYFFWIILTSIIVGGESLLYVGIVLSLIGGYLFIYNLLKENQKASLKIIKIIYSLGLFFAVFGVIFFLVGLNFPHGTTDNLRLFFGNVKYNNKIAISSFFHNENLLGELLMFSIPAAFALYLVNKKRKRIIPKRFYLFTFLFLIIVLYLSDARGGWIGVFFSLIFMSSSFIRKRMISILVLVFIAGIIGYFFLLSISPETIAKIGDPGIRPRLFLWQESYPLIKESPIVGVGLAQTRKAIVENIEEPLWIQTMHNNYLRTAVEIGIPGLLIYLTLLVVVARECRKRIKIIPEREKSIKDIVLLFAGGIFFGHIFFQFTQACIFGGLGFNSFFFLVVIAMILSFDVQRQLSVAKPESNNKTIK